MPLKPFEYLAGIIDGEGCLTIGKTMRKSDRSVSPTYASNLNVTNNNLELMNFLKENFVGRVYRKGNTKSYVWFARNNDTTWILENVLPFLIVKKEQAKILLEFRKTFVQGWHGMKMVPKEFIEVRESCWIAIKELNKKSKFRPNKMEQTLGIGLQKIRRDDSLERFTTESLV